MTKIEKKVDLRALQEQVEDNIKTLRAYGRKAERVYLGLLGMAYDSGQAWMASGKKFVEKAERRGLKVEQELSERVREMRDEATREVGNLRVRVTDRLDTVVKEVADRGEAVERKVQKVMEQVKARGANGAGVEVAEVKIEVEEELPIPGYDALRVDEISAKLGDMSADVLMKLRAYEAAHKNRITVLREIDSRLESVADQTAIPASQEAE
ncbi:MAG TPA: hypothetical protein VNK95_17520 [Caldilineaceae bacterium]|nr:hypothetical protein [Caldilineaceae bacterium]